MRKEVGGTGMRDMGHELEGGNARVAMQVAAERLRQRVVEGGARNTGVSHQQIGFMSKDSEGYKQI